MKQRQRGSFIVMTALLLLTLTGFAVLAFDVGRVILLRSEMQNVADAAALAGANCLTRQSDGGSTTNCLSTLSTTLNWARAAAKAQDHLGQNTAANLPIATTGGGHTIEVGYWNLSTGQPSGGTFSSTFSPLTANDRPAVRVFVRKDTGVNNGPLTMLTRLIYGGGSDVAMWAEAVAVISSPSVVPPGTLLPQVINKCMFDRFWDTTTNSPRLYTGDNTGLPPDTWSLQTVGQPFVVRIGSSYHYDTCESGQWTTFELSSNSASTVRGLINNGNPTELEIGDLIRINPGVQNSNYNDINDRYPNLPMNVNIAVVDDVDLADTGGEDIPIVAFAGFRLMASVGGSGKYIQGHFIPSFFTPGGAGVGPSFGTYTPPRLAH